MAHVIKKYFMKVLRFFLQPATVVFSFILLVIMGQQFASFYLFYLLIGLPHGAIHSITGFLGIGLMIFIRNNPDKSKKIVLKTFLHLCGVFLLWLSLILFFANDKSNYNISTFYYSVSQILLVLFFIISFSFFINHLLLLIKCFKHNRYKISA